MEDGSGTHTSSDGAFTTQLPTSGIYTLEITGNFPHFFGYPKGKLVDVNQWGDIAWGSMAYGQPGFPNDHPTQAPIDGGLGILAAAGGAYALKKLRDRRRQGGPEESMD